MQVLYKNEIVSIEYDPQRFLFKHTWNDRTIEMSVNKYKETVLLVNNWVKKLETKVHLVDTSRFAFVMEPEVQEWVAQQVFPTLLEKGVKKLAFLIASDFFAQVSIEQFVEENHTAPVQTLYFDDEQKALEWLFA